MSDRSLSPAVAVVALVGVTVALTAAVAAGTVALADDHSRTPAGDGSTPRVAFSLAVSDDTVALRHEGGPSLSVRRLRLRVEVGGTPLRHQPPVPFFAARGFRSGPTGPFNAAADGTWSAGERASFAVAGTNDPSFAEGRRVTVTVYGARRRLARLSAVVGS